MSTRPEESARLVEIHAWLQKPISVDEAMAEVCHLEDLPDTRTTPERLLESFLTIFTALWIFDLYWRWKDGPERPIADQFSG